MPKGGFSRPSTPTRALGWREELEPGDGALASVSMAAWRLPLATDRPAP